jgi:protein-tyrosine phosphatase
MRRIDNLPLWIGTARDARDIKVVLDHGIEAVIDLALEERPVSPTRDLVYLRFPLLDGLGNPPWLLRAAVSALEELMRNGVQTLVACGAGMSRSPALVAAMLGKFKGIEPTEALVSVSSGGPFDVSPGLWLELLAACKRPHSTTNN